VTAVTPNAHSGSLTINQAHRVLVATDSRKKNHEGAAVTTYRIALTMTKVLPAAMRTVTWVHWLWSRHYVIRIPIV